MRDKRESNIMLRILDLSELEEGALKMMQKDPRWEDFNPLPPDLGGSVLH